MFQNSLYEYLSSFYLLTTLTKECIILLSSTNQGIHKLMATLEQLLEVISDPYEDREEGVDFWVDEDGYIQTQDVRTAALIMRTANTSGVFDHNLVKVGQKGDSILLGFDTLLDAEPVFSIKIGYQKAISAEVKKDDNNKFCVYLDRKRGTRLFNKLASVKSYLKKLDKELQTQGQDVASYEESED